MCTMGALAAGTAPFGSCCSWCETGQCKPLFWMKCRLLDKNILLSGFGHIHRCCGFMENHLDPLTGEFLFHSSSDCWARAWPCLSSSGCWLIAHKHSCSSIVLINRKSYLSTCTYNPYMEKLLDEAIQREPAYPVVDQADRASPPGWTRVCLTMSAPSPRASARSSHLCFPKKPHSWSRCSRPDSVRQYLWLLGAFFSIICLTCMNLYINMYKMHKPP